MITLFVQPISFYFTKRYFGPRILIVSLLSSFQIRTQAFKSEFIIIEAPGYSFHHSFCKCVTNPARKHAASESKIEANAMSGQSRGL